MKRRIILLVAVAALLIVSLVIFNFVRSFIRRPVSNDSAFQLVTVASGFSNPVYVTHAGDGTTRLFVVEQGGLIRILQDNQILGTPFLDAASLIIRDGSEQGLLGLAFHPDYESNGQFFINYTAKDTGANTVARYQVSPADPTQADPASAVILLAIDDPYVNHNAGQLAFGPDGYLYVGTGDGGSGGDPLGNGQNGRALLGKMLRLDVNAQDGDTPYGIPPDNPFVGQPDFAPEVWAYGLRNPWRYSFDRATGDLYIADVGQFAWEEINFQPAASPGGENYGWNILEGTHPYSDAPAPAGLTMPIAEYNHSDGCSVTGGYVYRGAAIPALQGVYLFADFCSGTIWETRRDAGGSWATSAVMNSGVTISSFGEDEAGELYIVDYSGSILRIEGLTNQEG